MRRREKRLIKFRPSLFWDVDRNDLYIDLLPAVTRKAFLICEKTCHL